MIQEEEFSNKKKITLKRYNDLINRYNGLIDKWNAINLVKNNPTASKYFGDKAGISIRNDEKDKNKLVLDSSGSIDKKFNEYGTYTFDITQGFYHVILAGAGAGGLCSKIDIENGSPFNGNIAGSSGALIDFIFYAPFSVELKVSIGKGGDGKIEETYSRNNYVYGYSGDDSIITLNGNLLCKCEGGKSSRIYYNSSKKSSIVYQSEIATYFMGNLVRDIKFESNGLLGNGDGNGDTSEHTCPIISDYYKVDENGEIIKDLSNDDENNEDLESDKEVHYLGNGGSSNGSEANRGEDGYCLIETYMPTELGFISNGIELKSDELHILENENTIRNNIDESLKSIYNSLMKIDFSFDEERCYKIGKETDEQISDSKLKKFKDIFLDNQGNPIEYKNVKNADKIGYVKTSKQTGCFSEDDYVITYDDNIKRKMNVYDYEKFLKNSDESIYYMFCNKNNNNDIIYLKEIKDGATVYIYNDDYKELKPDGTCSLSERKIDIKETSTGDQTISVSASKDGYVNCIIVGAGGGGGGGSGGDHWFKSGAGGGSGSYYNGVYKIYQGQTFSAYCGKGGAGGNFTQKGPGEKGTKGNSSILKINSTEIVEAGAGGGGSGTTKHGSSGMQPSGNKGILDIKSQTQLIEVLESSDGNGNTDENRLIKTQEGMKSPFEGTTYGEGGRGGNNGNAGWQQQGLPGKDGYVRLMLKENLEIIYNNKIYNQYDGYDPNSGVILYSHYKYLKNRLDALENYLSVGDDWFDGNGYCRRTCQIKSQVDVNR